MSNDGMSRSGTRRREYLKGLASAGSVVLVAGCTSGGGGANNSGGGGANNSGGGGANNSGGGGANNSGGGGANNSGGGGAGSPLRIGYADAFTGEYGYLGPNNFAVLQTYAKQINDNGGVNGHKIKLSQGDTKAQPTTAKTVTKKFINTQNVHGLIGYTSLTVSAVIDMIKSNGVPTLDPLATTTAINSSGGKYFYRTVPDDNQTGVAMAVLAMRKDKNPYGALKNTVAMTSTKGLYTSFLNSLKYAIPKLGGNFDVVKFPPGKSSYSTVVSKTLSKNPDAIYLLVGPNAASKIQQAAFQGGYEGHWIAQEDVATSSYLKNTSSKLTDGMLGARPDSASYLSEQRLSKIKKNIKDTSGKPLGTRWRPHYDAIHSMALAALKASLNGGLSRENIAKNMGDIGRPPGKKVQSYSEGKSVLKSGSKVNFQGLASNCNWDKHGNISAPYRVIEVKDQAWTTINSVDSSVIKKYHP